MTGIKLTLNESGEADIWMPEELETDKRCLIDQCQLICSDWICGHSGLSIWDYYRDPGWCPLFKWYRTSRNKEFNNAEKRKQK